MFFSERQSYRSREGELPCPGSCPHGCSSWSRARLELVAAGEQAGNQPVSERGAQEKHPGAGMHALATARNATPRSPALSLVTLQVVPAFPGQGRLLQEPSPFGSTWGTQPPAQPRAGGLPPSDDTECVTPPGTPLNSHFVLEKREEARGTNGSPLPSQPQSAHSTLGTLSSPLSHRMACQVCPRR